jgi:hypothetical protein
MKKSAQQNAKHKPNTRHTLNEVLHSLEDMMHNELAGVELSREQTPAAPSRKEEALNNLKALIGSNSGPADVDRSESGLPADGPSADDKKAALADNLEQETPWEAPTVSADEPGDHVKEVEPDLPKADDIEVSDGATDIDVEADDGVPDSVADNDSSLAEVPPDDAPAAAPAEAPSVDDFALEMEDVQNPDAPPAGASEGEAKKKAGRRTDTSAGSTTGAAKQVEINWDDIPVLNDVVAPAPAPDDTTSKQAREIAIKVAAALNVELRREGTGTMDVKTIMRLQSLLGRELAEHGGISDREAGELGPENDKTTDDDA